MVPFLLLPPDCSALRSAEVKRGLRCSQELARAAQGRLGRERAAPCGCQTCSEEVVRMPCCRRKVCVGSVRRSWFLARQDWSCSGEEAVSSWGWWQPAPRLPQPPASHLVHGLLCLLGAAAVRLRHVAHRQRHRLEGVVPARQRRGERGLPDPRQPRERLVIPTDKTSVQSPPGSSRTLARGPALENGGGQTLADSKPRWGGSGRSCRLSSSPLFLQSARRTCTARQQSRWCTCWVGDFDPSLTGREERSITSPPSTDPPVCTGGCLG